MAGRATGPSGGGGGSGVLRGGFPAQTSRTGPGRVGRPTKPGRPWPKAPGDRPRRPGGPRTSNARAPGGPAPPSRFGAATTAAAAGAGRASPGGRGLPAPSVAARLRPLASSWPGPDPAPPRPSSAVEGALARRVHRFPASVDVQQGHPRRPAPGPAPRPRTPSSFSSVTQTSTVMVTSVARRLSGLRARYREQPPWTAWKASDGPGPGGAHPDEWATVRDVRLAALGRRPGPRFASTPQPRAGAATEPQVALPDRGLALVPGLARRGRQPGLVAGRGPISPPVARPPADPPARDPRGLASGLQCGSARRCGGPAWPSC